MPVVVVPESIKSVLVTFDSKTGEVKVTFTGDYIQKRELEMIMKAMRKEHKLCIINYRRQRIIAEYEQAKASSLAEPSDNIIIKENRNDSTGQKTNTGSNPSSGKANGTDPRAAGVAADGSTVNAGSTGTESGEGTGKVVSKSGS